MNSLSRVSQTTKKRKAERKSAQGVGTGGGRREGVSVLLKEHTEPYFTLAHLHNFHQDCPVRIVQVNSVREIPILCHHGSQQSNDIITFSHIVVTSLVTHCKLSEEVKRKLKVSQAGLAELKGTCYIS